MGFPAADQERQHEDSFSDRVCGCGVRRPQCRCRRRPGSSVQWLPLPLCQLPLRRQPIYPGYPVVPKVVKIEEPAVAKMEGAEETEEVAAAVPAALPFATFPYNFGYNYPYAFGHPQAVLPTAHAVVPTAHTVGVAAHPFTGITADGRHVANSVGALHIVKREAEADADADAYYGYGGYYGNRAYGYAPYGYAGYRGYGYRGYGLGYRRFGYGYHW